MGSSSSVEGRDPAVPALLTVHTLLPLTGLGILVANAEGLIFNSVPLIYIRSHVRTVLTCFGSFMVSCEVGKCESSNAALLFQDCVAYSGSLELLCEFWGPRVSSSKEASWDFDQDWEECVGHLGSFDVSVLSVLSSVPGA